MPTFHFKKVDQEIILFRFGLDIEANTIEEAIEILQKGEDEFTNDWISEKELEKMDVLSSDFYKESVDGKNKIEIG